MKNIKELNDEMVVKKHYDLLLKKIDGIRVELEDIREFFIKHDNKGKEIIILEAQAIGLEQAIQGLKVASNNYQEQVYPYLKAG